MKVNVNRETVNVLENVDFPHIIRETNNTAFLRGMADEPFYVCDLGDVLKKHNLWREKLSRVEPFYALKCNPNPLVVQMLAKLNVGFDCASRGEIVQVMDAGVSADRIIYANPCKQSSHLIYAAEKDVKMLTFDSVPELHKIALHHPHSDLVLRIFVGTNKARCPLGLKFGAYMEDVPDLIYTALSLNLNVIGVSFHVGSGCFDPEAYRTAIVLSHRVFNVAESLGVQMRMLDLGGGFPGNLDSPENIEFFISVCDTINECLDKFFPPEKGVKIIAEPGRYYVSSAFQLSCQVSSTRRIRTKDQDGYSYYLNDGVYGSFNCTIFDHYIGQHYVLDDCFVPLNDDTPLYPSIFWGPTCDSMDKILEGFTIRQLEIGDCVVFKDMGAYTMAAGSTFNGFQRPNVDYYSSYEDWIQLSSLLVDTMESLPLDQSMEIVECPKVESISEENQ